MHTHIIGILEQMRICQDHIGIRPGIVGQRGWDDVCAGHLDKVHVFKGSLVHIESHTLELLLQIREPGLPVKRRGLARSTGGHQRQHRVTTNKNDLTSLPFIVLPPSE